MKRVVLLTCLAIMVMSSTGCNKWKKKQYYRSGYVDGDGCGCGSTIAGPAVYDSYVPGPSSQIISAPSKGPLPTGQF
jgi:hypothetical protein